MQYLRKKGNILEGMYMTGNWISTSTGGGGGENI